MTLQALLIASLAISAIGSTDATPQERRILLRIAELESGVFRREVATCRVLGRIGERGLWQVVARDAAEARELCDVGRAAAIALQRVRESIAACGDLTGYVSGRCGMGKLEAGRRWVP